MSAVRILLAVLSLTLAGCAETAPDSASIPYHYAAASPACSAPTTLRGAVVNVDLMDDGMSGMMASRGDGPMGLRVTPLRVPAGTVSLLARNVGAQMHELVLLRLTGTVGARAMLSDRRVAETGSLGEASRTCGSGAGEGLVSGSVGWTTLTLAPGRHELICNLPGHYGNGMHAELLVT